MKAVLGIDIGTSGVKTLAMDREGRLLAQATSAEYPVHYPEPAWTEQDPADWWQAVVQTVAQVRERAGLRPDDVAAIGLSGQMHGSVFLDERQQVIRRALLWNDQRTQSQCDEITRRAGGPAELLRMVSNPALTGFTAPKILWLREREPDNFRRLRNVLLPKDYIRLRLTGQFATEVSDASGMLLLDVAARNWSSELLQKLELNPELFARCYESHEVTGTLTAAAARELGLSERCQVVGGAGDCAAGAVGTGIVEPGLLSTSIGTSGVVFVHSDTMQTDPQGRVHTFCHAVDGRWHMMGVNLSAGGSLQWFRNQLCGGLKAELAATQDDCYNLLSAEAAAVAPGAQGLYFLPYLAGERTPHADPHARGCFIGLTGAHTRGHMVRAIMEGVTYNLRASLDIFTGLGVPVQQIRATGGGAKSALWRQMQADILGRTVVRLQVDEGPAYGVAILAAVGAGWQPDVPTACRQYVQTRDETEPRPAAERAYAARYPIWSDLYPALKSQLARMAQVEAETATG